MTPKNNPVPAEDSGEIALRQLVERAQKGEQVDLEALRHALDNDPDIWHRAGDLGGLVVQSLITSVAGDNLLFRESLERKVAEMNKELAGPDATTLEKLLAQRTTLTWIQSNYGDLCTQATQGRSASIRQMQDAANRRFLASAKVLAMVQKLAVPRQKPSWKPKIKGA